MRVKRKEECVVIRSPRFYFSSRLTLASVVHLSPAQGGHFGLPGNLIVDGTPTVESTTKVSGETNYICGYESTNDIPDDQKYLHAVHFPFFFHPFVFQRSSTTDEPVSQFHDRRANILNLYVPSTPSFRTRQSHRRHVHADFRNPGRGT